ncbi:MAG: glycosyltransferase family 4 protein, partial [Solirubrobacterales bacterium]|nr:glycosyltransferase family 4 protein [Solirubrobacterales bacterium]
RTSEAGAVRLAASGRYRAVICGIDGRLALPGAYLAARARRIPFVLWATIWAHPTTAFHRLSRAPTRHLYRHADAVATYGPHVSHHVAGERGHAEGIAVAPQAVDVDHYGAPVPPAARAAWRERIGVADGAPLVLFAGRLVPEKGIATLVAAWRAAALEGSGARLALAGDGPLRATVERDLPDAAALGRVEPADLPALYAAADLLVLPSVRTASFLEPWGLVCNEAMLQRTPVLASDAVGALAGGLVRDGRNGRSVPAGDAAALAAALGELASDGELRARLGEAARADAAAYTPAAWAAGMGSALALAGAARAPA